MPAKPGSGNLVDIKMLMAALAISTTLGLWNLFATTDKPVTTQTTVDLQTSPAAAIESPVQPVFRGKILFGGQPPSQQTILVQRPRPKNSQQPAPVTRTRSS